MNSDLNSTQLISSINSLMDQELSSADRIKRRLITFVEEPLRKRLLMKEHITTTLSSLSNAFSSRLLIRVMVISNWGPLLLMWSIHLINGIAQKPKLKGITF